MKLNSHSNSHTRSVNAKAVSGQTPTPQRFHPERATGIEPATLSLGS